MKICIVSCSPYINTGYGIACKNLLKTLIDLNHEVCVYSLYGTEGVIGTYKYKDQIVPLFPKDLNQIDPIAGLKCAKKIFNWDLVWCIYDLFPLLPKNMQDDYWVVQLMLDSKPIMAKNINQLKEVNHVLCVTNDALKTLKDNDNIYDHQLHNVFPLLVDSNDFYIEAGAKEKFADYFNVEVKGNIICFNGANYSDGGIERKNIPELIRWWKEWQYAHKNDILYMHTDVVGDLGRGVTIEKLCKLYRCDISNILFPYQLHYRYNMITSDFLRMIYNASDCLLVPSHSEGFGYPYVESALCGTIPIGNDFGSGCEILSDCGGELIRCQEQYYTQNSVKSKSYWYDIDFTVRKALDRSSPELSIQLNKNAQKFLMKNNTKHLEDLLDKCEKHIKEQNKGEDYALSKGSDQI